MKKKQRDITKKEYRLDDENRIIVAMNVKDDSNFLSAFSTNDKPVISNEVAEFLETVTYTVPPNEQLSLHIKSDCIDETEKQIYREAIKEHYADKYHESEKELKIFNRVALGLAIVGVLILAAAIFLEYKVESVLWAEVIDILAWVFLWEAADIKFLRTRELAIQRTRYLALSTMKIEYSV